MALKFTQNKSTIAGEGGTYDHSLLVNRGMPDQHSIDSITGLRAILDSKYEKPFSGIPKKDMGFNVATIEDIENLKQTDIYNISNQLQRIVEEVVSARGDKETLKEYIDSKVSYNDWSGAGGVGSSSSMNVGYPLYQEFHVATSKREFQFSQTYKVGSRQLELYLNGLRMVEGFDYIEVNESQIEFLYDVLPGDHVLGVVRAIITHGLHEEFVSEEGQTEFSLMNPYAIYQNLLQVYRNGVLQRKGRDYKEITNHLVEFYDGLVEGDLITFHQSGANDPIVGTIIDTEIGRLKMSNAEMRIQLQEVSRKESTVHSDMYVDTFLSADMIDKDKSFDFSLVSQTISVSDSELKYDTKEEFNRGIQAGVTSEAWRDRIVLKNMYGAVETSVFNEPTRSASSHHRSIDYVRSVLSDKSVLEVFSEADEYNNGFIRTKLTKIDEHNNTIEYSNEIRDSKGVFNEFSIKCDGLNTFVSYTHYDEGSAIFVISFSKGEVVAHEQITEFVENTKNSSVDSNEEMTIVVYESERIKKGISNIDYKIKTDDWTGVRQITSDDVFESKTPFVTIGRNGVSYVAYSTESINVTNEDIVIAMIGADGNIDKMVLTNAIHDCKKPIIRFGADNHLRVCWMSKRYLENYGVDGVFIYNDGTISAERTIYSPASSKEASNVMMSVDKQNATHVFIETNEKDVSMKNISYAYITPNNDVTQYGNIASDNEDDVLIGNSCVTYDSIELACRTKDESMVVIKKLANYMTSGYFTVEYDGLSTNTEWYEFSSESIIPEDTTLSFEIRTSNDYATWLEWDDVSTLKNSPMTGRYVQVRCKLTSKGESTPEVLSLSIKCKPDLIEIVSVPLPIDIDKQSVILMSDFEGDIRFEISRNGGETFKEATVNRSTSMLDIPSTGELVLKALMKKGSSLKSWAAIW